MLSMLSDDFMKGFIWQLFMHKWRNYGLYVHCWVLFLGCSKLGILGYLVFSYKMNIGEELTEETRWFYVALSIVLMVLIFLHTVFEVSSIFQLVSSRTDLNSRGKLRTGIRVFMASYWEFLSAIFIFASCIMLRSWQMPRSQVCSQVGGPGVQVLSA